jgi:acyl-CoA synthetase (AMP-forming)/AMP-acid ligase II
MDEKMDRLSNVFADALVARGVQRGDRVALLMHECPQFAVCQLGLWKVGAEVVPINPRCTEEELSRAMVESGAEIAVVLTFFYHKIRVVQPHTSLRRIIVTNGWTIHHVSCTASLHPDRGLSAESGRRDLRPGMITCSGYFSP